MNAAPFLLDQVDFFRLDACRKLDPQRRAEFGQFLTPAPTARLMASMFECPGISVRLLDAGAGVGSLSAAFVSEICKRERRPESVTLTAYEVEPAFLGYLNSTLARCKAECQSAGIEFTARVFQEDFIEEGVGILSGSLFSSMPKETFDCAILNPPYRKIHSDSKTRRMLSTVGVETSNLYTGFLSIVVMLLAPGGELVAITPRSFCNGPYFRPFRKLLLEAMTIGRVHVFESREQAFREDEVLQENVIFQGIKAGERRGKVTISCSSGPEDEFVASREVQYQELVRPNDPDCFIHIIPDEFGSQVAERMAHFKCSLQEIGCSVSTGRVVEFRATEYLRDNPEKDTVPLVHPGNFEGGFIRWPKPNGKKPTAMVAAPGSEDLLVPAAHYVLVKRFSAKEQRRRVVAAVYDPGRILAANVGFENHLNYYHEGGKGLPETLAKGLAAFLNSTLVDLYFRQFNGHTQVNATDLRNFKYPLREQLTALGSKIGDYFPSQGVLDQYVEELLQMPEGNSTVNPVKAKKKIDQALKILRDLGLPRGQRNERSSLTMLALLNLKPESSWSSAEAPLIGITPMMEFFAEYYGKRYAPNTRETVRRQTVHQFLDAGIIVINPDESTRPTNSPETVYQIEPSVLKLIRTFGTSEWQKNLRIYLSSVRTLRERYAQERKMKRIPLKLPSGQKITLSPGGQNVLVQRIMDDFCSFFTPEAKPVYVGDTAEKWAYFDEPLLQSLGVTIESHGKMPDVVVYMEDKHWLVLIEAVMTHGPVDPKRRNELKNLFKDCKPGLVFVTAFIDRRSMVRYLNDISWETEVWVADAPTHLIHFNGERFLGPYEQT